MNFTTCFVAPCLPKTSDYARLNAAIQIIAHKIRFHFPDDELKFKNGEILDFVNKDASNPGVIYQQTTRTENKNPFYFYYCGFLEVIDNDYYLHLTNSKKGKKKSLLSLSKILHLFDKQNRSAVVILDIYPSTDGIELGEAPSVPKNVLLVKIFRDTDGQSNGDDNFAVSLFDLMEIVPEFTLKQALSYFSHAKSINTSKLDGNTKLLELSLSGKRRSNIWDRDADNFSSPNRGSREDGLQTLKFLNSDTHYKRDATTLLNFFAYADPSNSVRAAAGKVLRLETVPIPTSISIGTSKIASSYFSDWKLVPAGKFIMGSDSSEDDFSLKEEQPKHCCYVDEFRIAPNPVSISEWKAYLVDTMQFSVIDARGKNETKMPMTGVTWYQALNYSRWLTMRARYLGLLGNDEEIRMPTEAEWEKAARGETGRVFPWGDQDPKGRCNYRDSGHGQPIEFGTYGVSAKSIYGVNDMAGNVWEWTLSNWGPMGSSPMYKYPYTSSDGREDIYAPANIRRVIRGGAFYYFDYCLRCSTRNLMFPDTSHSGGGVRLIISKKKLVEPKP